MVPYTAKQYNLNLLSEENVKKYVLPEYNLQNSNISRVKLKNTDKQRAVYKVESSEKCYCLKKVYFSKEELLFVYSAMEWLSKCGINTPIILSTKDRGRFVDYKDMLFILTPWIDGVKCDYDDKDHVLSSMINLSKMHDYSRGFTPIEGSKFRKKFDNLPHSLNKHFMQIINCSNLAYKNKDRFSKMFLKYFDQNYKLGEISTKVSSTIKVNNLKTSLCHLDYVNKNILFDEDDNVWVIDFDKCGIDYCAHDISYFFRRYLKRDSSIWDIDTTIHCLETYEKSNPLNLDEYKYIFSYLTFPQKFWKISRDYYNNIKRCNHTAFVYLLKKSLGKEDLQMNFANNFKDYIENKFDAKLM